MPATPAVNLGPINRIPAGEGRVFEVDGTEVAIFHDRSGAVYATQSQCPHANGPLADGLMGHGAVMCPLHDRTFDLSSGESTNSDCSIKVYAVNLNSDREILLTLE